MSKSEMPGYRASGSQTAKMRHKVDNSSFKNFDEKPEPLLKLKLLGAPEISINDDFLVNLGSRKAAALLTYLVMTPGVTTRDTLAALLWPEMAEEAAKNNLRTTLTVLNRRLHPYINATPAYVGFKHNRPYILDVERLRLEIGEAQAASNLTLLQAALKLYEGEFLQGFHVRGAAPFEQWMLQQREELHLLALGALEMLGALSLQKGEYAIGYAAARQLLTLEPWSEMGHRQIMVLLASKGQNTQALLQYETCRQVLADEFGMEPAPETVQLYQEIKTGQFTRKSGFELCGYSENKEPHQEPATANPFPWQAQSVDWGDAPAPDFFYGREAETQQLRRWLVDDRCQMIAVLGMGGMGKTTLTAHVVRAIAAQFDVVLWRSLLNAPPLTEIVSAALDLLAPQSLADLPTSLDEQLNILFRLFGEQRCLLILDNLESVLQSERAGAFRPGHDAYGQLMRRFGDSTHQSCLMVTSRECPQQIQLAQSTHSRVRVLSLGGLSTEAGAELLQAHWGSPERAVATARDIGRSASNLALPALSGRATDYVDLVQRYSGNPLALKLVAATIRELFDGDPALFLREELLIFEDIRDLLDQQFVRLSEAEMELLLWLAIEREPVSFQEWQMNLANPVKTQILLEVVRALEKRSLIQNNQGRYSMQNVVLEYATEHLLTAVLFELDKWMQHIGEHATTDALADRHFAAPSSAPVIWKYSHFNNFALTKARAKENARAGQIRMLLQPVAQHLRQDWRTNALQFGLQKLLRTLQQREPPLVPGYGAANVIHLCHELGIRLQDLDFSKLTVWQADLARTNTRRVDFLHSDLSGSTFIEPLREVRAIAMSPDGQLLASATGSGQINIWQMNTLRLVATLDGHKKLVYALEFGADGQMLVSAETGGFTIVWRRSASATWQNCLEFHSLGGDIPRLAFSPDARLLAISQGNQPISLWELCLEEGAYSAQLRFSLGEHAGQRIIPIAIRPDGKVLASGDQERIQLWDLKRGIWLQTLQGHTERVQSLAYSPSGELLASGGTDGTVRLWRAVSGEPVAVLDGHRVRVLDLVFSQDGRMLATADLKNIRLWNIAESGRQQAAGLSKSSRQSEEQPVNLHLVLTEHTHFITALAFSPDGCTLVSASLDETMRMWDVATGEQMRIMLGYRSALYAVAVHAHMLVTGDVNGAVQLWRIKNAGAVQQAETLANCSKRILSVAFSPDGQHVVATCADERLYLWHVPTKAQLFALEDPRFDFGLGKVVFSPDGQLFATICSDQRVRLWRTKDGALVHLLGAHTIQFRCIAFSPDGQTFVAGVQEGQLYLWDLSRARGSGIIQPDETLDYVENECIIGVHFAVYGDRLVYSGNSSIYVMDWSVRKRTLSMLGTYAWSRALALSKEGVVAIDRISGLIELFDVTSGEAVGQLPGHRDVVQDLAFDATGKVLYSVSLDGEIRVWDVENQTCLDVVQSELPYEGMNITGATGLSKVRRTSLCKLGAVELLQ